MFTFTSSTPCAFSLLAFQSTDTLKLCERIIRDVDRDLTAQLREVFDQDMDVLVHALPRPRIIGSRFSWEWSLLQTSGSWPGGPKAGWRHLRDQPRRRTNQPSWMEVSGARPSAASTHRSSARGALLSSSRRLRQSGMNPSMSLVKRSP